MSWWFAGERGTPLWRRSLQLRIVTISLVLSCIALAIVGGFTSISIGSNLFEQQRDESVLASVRATADAQAVFREVSSSSTSLELAQVQERALASVASSIASPGLNAYAMLRSEGQPVATVQLNDTQVTGFDDSLLTSELRAAVAAGGGEAFYQSVQLTGQDGSVPGIIVGTLLDVPGAGQYELYIVHSLADAQSTLVSTQQTMALGGLGLLVLIGLVTWLVVRMVVGPVQVAAATSVQLAAGKLDQRIAVVGDDELATLGRAFNNMADSISNQIAQLGELSEVQQRFVSDVSHELRTPLTTIRLAGDVLYDRRDELDPTAKRTAELLHAQIDRFETMLADLLELSRFDAGAATLDIEPTNIVRLAEAEVDAISLLAEERGSSVHLVAPGGHFNADIDPRRIRRILQNLLANAVDHGEGKPITVTVDSNVAAVGIAVRDHGIGMTQQDREHVFDRFWRADPSRQRRTGGTGLGLAISQEDAALHGGWIDVWSVPGEGSAFRLTLPRAQGVAVGSPIALPPAESSIDADGAVTHSDVATGER